MKEGGFPWSYGNDRKGRGEEVQKVTRGGRVLENKNSGQYGTKVKRILKGCCTLREINKMFGGEESFVQGFVGSVVGRCLRLLGLIAAFFCFF